MENTITAQNGGYSVGYVFRKCAIAEHTDKIAKVYDGEEFIFEALVGTMDEYEDEKRQNEYFVFYEQFTTIRGNTFIYWGDVKTGLNYLTKIKEIKQ